MTIEIQLPEGMELGEFKPCFVYNRELDILEWFAEDVGHYAQSVGPPHAADVLRAFDDNRIVGVQIWGAKAIIATLEQELRHPDDNQNAVRVAKQATGEG